MKNLKRIFILFLFGTMLFSCDNDDIEENIIIINNSYNNSNDSTKTNGNQNNNSNKSTGTIDFGLSDLTQG